MVHCVWTRQSLGKDYQGHQSINQRNWTLTKCEQPSVKTVWDFGINCPVKTKELFGIKPDICVIIIAAQILLQSFENNKSHTPGFNNFGFCSRIRSVAT